MNIRILLPSKGRLQQLANVIEMLVPGLSDNTRLYVIQDDKDGVVDFKEHPHLRVVSTSTKGYWNILNEWLTYSGDDIDPFIWLADDIIPRTGWLQKAIDCWHESISNCLGLLVLNDLYAQDQTAAFAMTTPSWLYVLFDNNRFPNHFGHNFVDTIVADRSKSLNRFVFCKRSIVEHVHWTNGKTAIDDTYRSNRARAKAFGDKKLKDAMDREWVSSERKNALRRLNEQ